MTLLLANGTYEIASWVDLFEQMLMKWGVMMKIRKYLLEIILFIGALGHFILSILNDLNLYQVSNGLLSIPVPYIVSVLFFVLLIYKERKRD